MKFFKIVALGFSFLFLLLINSCIDQPVDTSFTNIFFADISTNENGVGWTVGSQGMIYKTKDHGLSWTSQNSGTDRTLLSVFMLDENNVFACGDQGIILSSSNGGIKWDAKILDKNHPLRSVFFKDANNGVICGDSGKVYITSDAGKTWNLSITNTGSDLNDVYYSNDNNLYVCGRASTGKALLKSTDLGINWTSMEDSSAFYYTSFTFVDNNEAYLVGGGIIKHTIDAGQKWDTLYIVKESDLTNPDNYTIYEKLCISNNKLIAAGHFGYNLSKMISNDQSNNNWLTIGNSNDAIHVLGMDFTNANTGIAVGGYGKKIYRSSDAGNTWNLTIVK